MSEDASRNPNALPNVVREHLGRELRSTYAATAEKPRYLGDPTMPPTIAEKVVRLEGRLKAHEHGTEAVEDALAPLLADGARGLRR